MAASIVQAVLVSQSLTGGITVTAGNTIVVLVMDFNPNVSDDTGISVQPVSDTLNGSVAYTGPATVGGIIGFHGSMSAHYFSGTAGGTTTVSINENSLGFPPDPTRTYWAIIEVSGVGALDSVVTIGQGPAAFTSFGSGATDFQITSAISNTASSGVVLAMGYTNQGAIVMSAGSVFSDLGGLPNLSIGASQNDIRFQGQVISGVTGIPVTWNCTDSTQNFSAIAVFFATSGPSITQQPSTIYYPAGGGSSGATVVAVGPGSLSYQWRRNGINVGGATSATYSGPFAYRDQGARYDCVVTDSGGGSVTTNPVSAYMLGGFDIFLRTGQAAANDIGLLDPTTTQGSTAAAGEADGASTAAAAITGSIGASGEADGAGAGSAAIGGSIPATGAAAGSSTATGSIGGKVAASGEADGAATVAGAITGTGQVAGAAAGTGAASGTAGGSIPAAGAAAGSSTASASPGGGISAAGQATGTATAAAAATGSASVAGSSGGAGGASGSLSGAIAAAGTAAGSATAAAAVTGGVVASGTTAGAGAATGAVTGGAAVSGAAAGTSTAALVVTVPAPLTPPTQARPATTQGVIKSKVLAVRASSVEQAAAMFRQIIGAFAPAGISFVSVTVAGNRIYANYVLAGRQYAITCRFVSGGVVSY